MTRAPKSERGQALILFAVTFIVLCGIVGLVIDVGWGYYVGKRAQNAVDAAAMAGVVAAVQSSAGSSPVCGTVGCQGATACPSAGNLQVACAYAASNGFSQNGENGVQQVKVAADISSPPPGVPNIAVDYWVQVTASQGVPKWFSGLVSNAPLTSAAQATAAIRSIKFGVSLDLLNRKSDCFVSALNVGLVCGEDFLALGLNSINARNGIYMSSSNPTGLGLPDIAAGTVTGETTVEAPFTYLMGKGGIQGLLGVARWDSAPKNGFPDSDYFTDPMAGKAQPPVPAGLPDHPVPGGVITGSLLSSAPTVLPPGNYYATSPVRLLGLGPTTALGTPITIAGNVVFSDGKNPPCGGFCNYVFYGGLVTAALNTVTFSPGRYVFAGAQPVAGGPGAGFTVGANSVVKDMTPLVNGQITRNTDAGEIFIFTDSNYPGLTLPAEIASAGLSFPQARAGVVAGVNPSITLHGLNASSPNLPSDLSGYAPVLIWQDRANTTLKYQSNGLLDMSCGVIPCNNILSVPGTQEMILSASQQAGHAGTNLYGTIYGPRGSWLTIAGLLPGDQVAGPLQIITGALQMTLFAGLDLQALPNPPTRRVVGMVQ